MTLREYRVHGSSEAVVDRVLGLAARLPSMSAPFTAAFGLSRGEGEARIFRYSNDPTWEQFPFPIDQGVLYVFDHTIPARATGGAMEGRASLRALPQEADAVVLCRVWHELLHSVGQPADDMHQRREAWQTLADRLWWAVWPLIFGPGSHDTPYWHARYYAWLTRRAEAGGE